MDHCCFKIVAVSGFPPHIEDQRGACGIAFTRNLEEGLEALGKLSHRAAKNAGSGVLVDINSQVWECWKQNYPAVGRLLLHKSTERLATGQLIIAANRDGQVTREQREAATRRLVEIVGRATKVFNRLFPDRCVDPKVVLVQTMGYDYEVLGDGEHGDSAALRQLAGQYFQVFVEHDNQTASDDIDLFGALVELSVMFDPDQLMFLCSLSSTHMVYKGLQSGEHLKAFKDLESFIRQGVEFSIVLGHNRFPTNELPDPRNAQPIKSVTNGEDVDADKLVDWFKLYADVIEKKLGFRPFNWGLSDSGWREVYVITLRLLGGMSQAEALVIAFGRAKSQEVREWITAAGWVQEGPGRTWAVNRPGEVVSISDALANRPVGMTAQAGSSEYGVVDLGGAPVEDVSSCLIRLADQVIIPLDVSSTYSEAVRQGVQDQLCRVAPILTSLSGDVDVVQIRYPGGPAFLNDSKEWWTQWGRGVKKPIGSLGRQMRTPKLDRPDPSYVPGLVSSESHVSLTAPPVDIARNPAQDGLHTVLSAKPTPGDIAKGHVLPGCLTQSPIMTPATLNQVEGQMSSKGASVCKVNVTFKRGDHFDLDAHLSRLKTQACQEVDSGAAMIIFSDRDMLGDDQLGSIYAIDVLKYVVQELVGYVQRKNKETDGSDDITRLPAVVIDMASCAHPATMVGAFSWGANAVCPWPAFVGDLDDLQVHNRLAGFEFSLKLAMSRLGLRNVSSFTGLKTNRPMTDEADIGYMGDVYALQAKMTAHDWARLARVEDSEMAVLSGGHGTGHAPDKGLVGTRHFTTAAIANLHRATESGTFVTYEVYEAGLQNDGCVKVKSAQQIAIVGAGFAGLLAAGEFLKAGWQVVVYGTGLFSGLVHEAIPFHHSSDRNGKINAALRTLQAFLDSDQLRYINSWVGPKQMTAIRAAFPFVMVATGAQSPRTLSVEGTRHPHILTVQDYAKFYTGTGDRSNTLLQGHAADGSRVIIEPNSTSAQNLKVAVIGAGNAAIDVAYAAVVYPLLARRSDAEDILPGFSKFPAQIRHAFKRMKTTSLTFLIRKGPDGMACDSPVLDEFLEVCKRLGVVVSANRPGFRRGEPEEDESIGTDMVGVEFLFECETASFEAIEYAPQTIRLNYRDRQVSGIQSRTFHRVVTALGQTRDLETLGLSDADLESDQIHAIGFAGSNGQGAIPETERGVQNAVSSIQALAAHMDGRPPVYLDSNLHKAGLADPKTQDPGLRHRIYVAQTGRDRPGHLFGKKVQERERILRGYRHEIDTIPPVPLLMRPDIPKPTGEIYSQVRTIFLQMNGGIKHSITLTPDMPGDMSLTTVMNTYLADQGLPPIKTGCQQRGSCADCTCQVMQGALSTGVSDASFGLLNAWFSDGRVGHTEGHRFLSCEVRIEHVPDQAVFTPEAHR